MNLLTRFAGWGLAQHVAVERLDFLGHAFGEPVAVADRVARVPRPEMAVAAEIVGDLALSRPMNRILQLREMAIEHGIKGNAGARHTGIFTKSIEDGGRLNEVWMVPGSVGIFNVPRMMKETMGALKMLRAPQAASA